MTRLKLNLGAGAHPLAGFENLDLADGWRFEYGLPYDDASVDAATVSHALMFVAEADLPAVLADIYRALKPGGILRVTEDNCEDPASERYGGWHDAVCLTGLVMMRALLRDAGFRVRRHTATSTGWGDDSLLQAFHGGEPKVFFIEGRKP